ncbi:MAG: hypothetical protein VW079_01590 [Candidatus Woesearchaeota archaeon]
MRKEIFLKNKNNFFNMLILFNSFILVLFSYMTYIFHNSTKNTSYELLTFLIASPVLLSFILFIAIFVFGKKQVISELEELLTGSRS